MDEKKWLAGGIGVEFKSENYKELLKKINAVDVTPKNNPTGTLYYVFTNKIS